MQAIYINDNITFHGNASQYGMDGLIMDGEAEMSVSFPGAELEACDLTFTVYSTALVDGTGTDWRTLTPGTAMDLYAKPGGDYIRTYYLREVKRVSRKTVQITATDALGRLDMMDDHNGGIYTGEIAFYAISEIFYGSNIDWTVVLSVDGVDGPGRAKLYGHLPRDTRRNNLARILAATGAVLVADPAHTNEYKIEYPIGLDFPTGQVIAKHAYLDSGDTWKESPATAIEVTEHGFYALSGDKTETLFDNTNESTAASSQLVVFDEPCHDLVANGLPVESNGVNYNGLTVESSGVNYAVVTGTGTLTGQVYTHTQRVLTYPTGVTGEPRTVIMDDNELVGFHNSLTVAKRLAAYYAPTGTVSRATVEAYDPYGGRYPYLGALAGFRDPWGTSINGYLEHKRITLAKKSQATFDFISSFKPGPFGSNINTFDLHTDAGTITVPAGVTSMTVVLGAGGDGGDGGSDGGDGDDGDGYAQAGVGGTGGSGGTAGSPGKIYQFALAVTPGDTITIAPGSAGSAGAAGGGSGGSGTDTTITYNGTTYSSASGSVLSNGYGNLDTGEVYGQAGRNGIAGGNGGTWSTDGGDASTSDEAYAGGEAGISERHHISTTNGTFYMRGGGGSGAVYGHDGVTGGNRRWYSVYDYEGGAGANAPTPDELPGTPTLSSGGDGGNGGGGGGAGGSAWHRLHNVDYDEPWAAIQGAGGLGSDGTAGKAGGAGFALFMY